MMHRARELHERKESRIALARCGIGRIGLPDAPAKRSRRKSAPDSTTICQSIAAIRSPSESDEFDESDNQGEAMPLFPAILRVAIALPATALALPAFAHDGLHAMTAAAGFLHPLTGFDHLLAMLAIGIWAAQQRLPARIAL